MLFRDIKVGSYFCVNNDNLNRIWYKPEERNNINAILIKKYGHDVLNLCVVDNWQHFIPCDKDGKYIYVQVKFDTLMFGDTFKFDDKSDLIYEKVRIESSTLNSFCLKSKNMYFVTEDTLCYKCDKNGKLI